MKKPNQRPDVVQWLDKTANRYLKIERATGETISQKVTEGPYKNIHIAKRRPSVKATATRTIKEAPGKGTISRKTAQAAVKAVADVKKKKAPAKKKERKPRKVNYLNNKDLLIEVQKSKENDPPQMTDKLAHMLQTLAARYGKKANFVGYSYNEDMQAFAMMMLVRTWKSFNPEKSQNPFAFFTQCIKNSFIQYLNSERRQRDVRDLLLVDQGLDASYTYQDKYNQEMAERKAKDSDEVVQDVVETTDGSDGVIEQ